MNHIFCFEADPSHFRNVAVVLLGQVLRAKPKAFQYLYPMRIPIKQPEDLD